MLLDQPVRLSRTKEHCTSRTFRLESSLGNILFLLNSYDETYKVGRAFFLWEHSLIMNQKFFLWYKWRGKRRFWWIQPWWQEVLGFQRFSKTSIKIKQGTIFSVSELKQKMKKSLPVVNPVFSFCKRHQLSIHNPRKDIDAENVSLSTIFKKTYHFCFSNKKR